MILADTSVWVDHLRRPNSEMIERLTARDILIHPFVIGELACGTLPDRSVLQRLGSVDICEIRQSSNPITSFPRKRESRSTISQSRSLRLEVYGFPPARE